MIVAFTPPLAIVCLFITRLSTIDWQNSGLFVRIYLGKPGHISGLVRWATLIDMPRIDASGTATQVDTTGSLRLSIPDIGDGADLWRLAGAAQSLDVNSRYSYLLWCRDFAATSVIARDGERLAGFITGYLRPTRPDTLFIWQVAVSPTHRRQGLARRMLDHLVDRLIPQGVDLVEATVTPGNLPSTRLFTSFAQARGVELARDELFSEEMLGDGHEAENRFLIGPLTGRT